MSLKRKISIPIFLILSALTSSPTFGRSGQQASEPPPCAHTSKSYPEAVCLGDLAQVLMDQGKYDEAETILKRELKVRQAAVGTDGPDTVSTLNRLALVYQKENRNAETESLLKRALAIRQKAFGANNLQVADSKQVLADFYHAQKRDEEAEQLLKEALATEEKVLQPSDRAYPTISWTLTDLGRLYESEKRYSEAEPAFTRALKIYENAPSPNYFNIGDSRFEVATVLALEGKYPEADMYFKLTLGTMENALGPDNPRITPVLDVYAALLQRMNRASEAESMKVRADNIRAKAKH